MSKTEEFYRTLVKDPELEIKSGLSRKQAARQEAEYRARQYNNNVEALALATKPAESPINSLLDHVQVNKSYKDTALIKLSNIFGRKKKNETGNEDPLVKYFDIVQRAQKDEEEGDTDRDEEYHNHAKDLVGQAKKQVEKIKTLTSRQQDVLSDYQKSVDLSKKLTRIRGGAKETLTATEKKLDEQLKNWRNPVSKDRYVDKFEWGKTIKNDSARGLTPSEFYRQVGQQRDIQQQLGNHMKSLAKDLAESGPVKRHTETLKSKDKDIEGIKTDEKIKETDDQAINAYNKKANQPATKIVDDSVTENQSEPAKKGSSESEKKEASEKRIQDLKDHTENIENAIGNHDTNKPARGQVEVADADVDLEEASKDYLGESEHKRLLESGELSGKSFSQIKDEYDAEDGDFYAPPMEEEGNDSYNDRSDVQAWQSRLDHMNDISDLTDDRLKDEIAGNESKGVNDDLQLDEPTPQEAGSEIGLSVGDFSDTVQDNYNGGVGQLQEHTNAAQGLFRDDKGQFTVEGEPSGPFYNKEENRPMTKNEALNVTTEGVEPDTESGGVLGRGNPTQGTLNAISKEYENRFGEPLTFDMKDGKPDTNSELYRTLEKAGVFHHDEQSIKDKDGNEVPVGKGTDFHKNQSKFSMDRFKPNQKDDSITNDGTNASIDDVYDHMKRAVDNPDLYLKSVKGELDELSLAAQEAYKKEQSPENEARYRASIERRNVDLPREQHKNWDTVKTDTDKGIKQSTQPTPEPEQTGGGETSEQSTSEPQKQRAPHPSVKEHLGDQYKEKLDNGELHNEDGTPKSVGQIREEFPKEEPKTVTKPTAKAENTTVPDDVKAYMTDKGYSDEQIGDMEEKGLFHPNKDRTEPPFGKSAIENFHDNEDTFNEYKDQSSSGSDTGPEAEPKVDPAIQSQLDKAAAAGLIKHAYEQEFGLGEEEEGEYHKYADYEKDFIEEHANKSLGQVNKKLEQISKSRRQFEPKQSPEEKADTKEKQQTADTSPIPHNELMKTDKGQKTAEMHAVAIDNHLKKHGKEMSPKAKANLEHAKTENDKQIHPSTRSHMEREKKKRKDDYGSDEHLAELKQKHLDDQHETHIAESEDPAHQSHRDEQGAKSKANEYITSVDKRDDKEKDSPDIYGEHSVESDKDGKISSKDHPLSGDRESSKLRSPAEEKEQGDGPPDPDVARRKISEGYAWHKETRHWILKETLQEQHGGMGGLSGGLMNGHAKNAAGKNIFENEHGEAGSGVFHLSGGNTNKLGHGLGGKALQAHYNKSGELANHTASGNDFSKINNTKAGMSKAGLGSKIPKAPVPKGFAEGFKSGWKGSDTSQQFGPSPYSAKFKADAKSAISSFTSRFGGGGVEKSYLASPEIVHQSRVDLLKRLDKVV